MNAHGTRDEECPYCLGQGKITRSQTIENRTITHEEKCRLCNGLRRICPCLDCSMFRLTVSVSELTYTIKLYEFSKAVSPQPKKG